jgi:hypothetical protein
MILTFQKGLFGRRWVALPGNPDDLRRPVLLLPQRRRRRFRRQEVRRQRDLLRRRRQTLRKRNRKWIQKPSLHHPASSAKPQRRRQICFAVLFQCHGSFQSFLVFAQVFANLKGNVIENCRALHGYQWPVLASFFHF